MTDFTEQSFCELIIQTGGDRDAGSSPQQFRFVPISSSCEDRMSESEMVKNLWLFCYICLTVPIEKIPFAKKTVRQVKNRLN